MKVRITIALLLLTLCVMCASSTAKDSAAEVLDVETFLDLDRVKRSPTGYYGGGRRYYDSSSSDYHGHGHHHHHGHHDHHGHHGYRSYRPPQPRPYYRNSRYSGPGRYSYDRYGK